MNEPGMYFTYLPSNTKHIDISPGYLISYNLTKIIWLIFWNYNSIIVIWTIIRSISFSSPCAENYLHKIRQKKTEEKW